MRLLGRCVCCARTTVCRQPWSSLRLRHNPRVLHPVCWTLCSSSSAAGQVDRM
jgi:hypothetical protein